MTRALRIPMAFARWYWAQVCRFPRDILLFAAGCAYASVLVTVPKVAFGIAHVLEGYAK